MADPAHQMRLSLEPLHPLRVLGPPALDHLDRDRPVQSLVVATKDATEGSLPNQLSELVAPVEDAPLGRGGRAHARKCGTPMPAATRRAARPSARAPRP